MFGYAANRGGFKLYISMDLYAYGDGCSKAGKTCNKVRCAIASNSSATPGLLAKHDSKHV